MGNPFKFFVKKFRLWTSGISMPIDAKVYYGRSYSMRGTMIQSKPGDESVVVQVPTESHPYNAYVYNIRLNQIVGFIEYGLSQDLFYIFGEKYVLDASIKNVQHTDEETKCIITVFSTSKNVKSFVDDIPYLLEPVDVTEITHE